MGQAPQRQLAQAHGPSIARLRTSADPILAPVVGIFAGFILFLEAQAAMRRIFSHKYQANAT